MLSVHASHGNICWLDGAAPPQGIFVMPTERIEVRNLSGDDRAAAADADHYSLPRWTLAHACVQIASTYVIDEPCIKTIERLEDRLEALSSQREAARLRRLP